MWNYFHTMLKSLRELPEYKGLNAPQLMASLFPNVQYIWIARRDKVRQAVSWAKAGQTDVYALYKGETPVPKREPTFDFEFIDHLYSLIFEGEKGWQDFLRPVEYSHSEYEELVEVYELAALRVLDYLNVSYPRNLVFGDFIMYQK